ncbi:MAG: DUF4350 domain-containing protein [Pseudomonadota bacterium]
MLRFDTIRRIAQKEVALFFAGGMGYLFLAAFLAVTLFVFFWGEAFFARNIADVRPLFEWMPVLLVFLASALTMRMWSEERRTGTLEFVQTLPVSPWEFVLGKFYACMQLLALALLLTLPLPLTVALLGDLDWGPVFAGYVAALLLGAAYIAIGLFVSARSDSQIVALILSCFLCGGLYLIGAGTVTDLFGGRVADALRAIGSGSRFESITRGVLDLRDLFYYASIAGGFLMLNVFSLERGRWAATGDAAAHRSWYVVTALVLVNLLVANVWLNEVRGVRLDLTEGQQYSLSGASVANLQRLEEPLLLRGYFSAKTHPLLAPLVPQMRDLLEEFEVAGGGKVRVEIVDPAEEPELEDEANSKYGIRAVPFQVADRYQSSLVNSYFDVLVSYGDEYEVLGFRDLIEVKVEGESELEVKLRNPEYDLTRSIKKAASGFRSGGDIFDSISEPVEFVGYVSGDAVLPLELQEFRGIIESVLAEVAAESSGKLTTRFIDPQAGDGSVAQQIAADYGFQPMAASFFDVNTFYYYLTLKGGDTVVQLPVPETRDADGFRRVLDDGMKRFAAGLLKSIVMVTPPPVPPQMAQQGMAGSSYNQLREFLSADYDVSSDDLSSGAVPATASVLLLLEPENLDDTQVFAIDQFLMRGGTVVVASSPFAVQASRQSLRASPRTSGLEGWLASYGVSMPEELVLDPQNAAFPVPVSRRVGGFTFQEMRLLDYPYFADVRAGGLSEDNGITADLPQLTMPWASPLVVDAAANESRTVETLIESSAGSWLSADANVLPNMDDSGGFGFAPADDRASQVLGVMIEGRFESTFAGQDSPLLAAAAEAAADAAEGEAEDDAEDDEPQVISSVIDRSAESARLFVFASNALASDQTLRMLGSAEGTLYINTLQLLANVVDWTLEDRDLLSIRSRGHFNRTLPPMEPESQQTAEYLNYVVALLAVLAVWFVYRARRRARENRYAGWLQEA